MATKEKNSAEQQTITKTLSFLGTMAQRGVSMTIMEIAEELNVSKPTAYAIVNSLHSLNYLEKDPDTNKYSIGYSFYVLGQSYPRQYPFLVYAEDYVRTLARNTGLRVNICVYKPPMYALVIASKDESVVQRHSGGYLMPAHVSASGKILLASLPDKDLKKIIYSSPLVKIAPKSITDPDKLMEELLAVRENGYATDEEEFVIGGVCTAAPVYNATGALVCTISLAKCPASRYAAERDQLIEAVRSTALQLSLDLGYPRELSAAFLN